MSPKYLSLPLLGLFFTLSQLSVEQAESWAPPQTGKRSRNPPQVILMFGAQNTLEKQYPRPFLSEVIRIPRDGVNLLGEATGIIPHVAQNGIDPRLVQ